MANSNYLGLITCPICKNERATVHQQTTGTKKGRLYYRCYTEINGATMRCGTIQCIGQAGQEFIKKNLRPIIGVTLEPIAQTEPEKNEIRPIGQPEPSPIEKEPKEPESIDQSKDEPAPVAKKSVWEYLTNE